MRVPSRLESGQSSPKGVLLGLRRTAVVLTVASLVMFIDLGIDSDSVGIPVLLHRFRSTGLVGLVLMGANALGALLVPAHWVRSPTAIVRLVLQVGVGLATWSGVLLVLGLCGWFSPPVIITTAAIMLGAPVLLRDGGMNSALDAFREVVGLRTSTLGRVTFVVSAIGTLALWMLAVTPAVAWDAAMYHLDLPAEWIAAGRIALPVDNLHVAFTGWPHPIYAFFLSAGAFEAPAVFQVTSMVALLLITWSVGRCFLGSDSGSWAALLVWCAGSAVLVAHSALVDLMVAVAVLGAIAHLLPLYEGKSEYVPGLLVMGALGVGVKYQGAAFIGAAGLLAVVAWLRRRLSLSSRAVLLGAFIAILLALPWYLKNWILLGDPMYPFISGERLPPWLEEVAAAVGRFPDLTSYPVLAEVRAPFNLKEWIFDPARLTVEAEGNLQGLPLIFLLGVVVLLRPATWRTGWVLILPVLIGVSAIVVVSAETNLRYVLPYVGPFAIAAGSTISTITERLRQAIGTLALMAAVALSTVPVFTHLATELVLHQGAAVSVGVASTNAWLSLPENSEHHRIQVTAPELVRRASGRTLLLFEARGWHFDAAVLQDNSSAAWPILNDLLRGRCLQYGDIDSVLVNESNLRYMRDRGARSTASEALGLFIGKCGNLEAREDGYALYRLRPGTGR